jgi:hypothetical protein
MYWVATTTSSYQTVRVVPPPARAYPAGSSQSESCTLFTFSASLERQLMSRNSPHFLPSIQQSSSPSSLPAVFAFTRHSTQIHVSRFGTWSGFGWNQLPQ